MPLAVRAWRASADREELSRRAAPNVSPSARAPPASTCCCAGNPKGEFVDVVMKPEGEPDQPMCVTLVKSEDEIDAWNLDAFGGGLVSTRHHFKPKSGESTPPFLTSSRAWNSSLPKTPGMHGILVFTDISGCPTQTLPVFAKEGTNKWVPEGLYDRRRWGKIDPRHISSIPSSVLEKRAKGMVSSEWRENRVQINGGWRNIYNTFLDGRLLLPFTILRCVGYPEDWFERLLDCENLKLQKNSEIETVKETGRYQGPRVATKQARIAQTGRRTVNVEESDEEEII
ncbi:hypothetical protein C8J57DRAFT_1479737 [Mycena rebaudengoi]|nr:hypothetical protein C8J57DRAFT_1479737 [Mycena rebaudengoi]